MSQNLQSYKVIILGESSVGKSSIIDRLTKNKFSEISISTVGQFYTEKILEIKNNKIKFEIWDTAGQEKFRALAKVFYKNAAVCILVYDNYYNGCDGAILVYDITNRKSYDELVNYWYNEILKNCPNIIFGIAGNKFDLFEKEKVNEKEAKEFADKIGAIFYSTSAKEGIGIDTLFQELGIKIYEANENTATFDETISSAKLNSIDIGNNKKKNCC